MSSHRELSQPFAAAATSPDFIIKMRQRPNAIHLEQWANPINFSPEDLPWPYQHPPISVPCAARFPDLRPLNSTGFAKVAYGRIDWHHWIRDYAPQPD
jgi:hypothetical protein